MSRQTDKERLWAAIAAGTIVLAMIVTIVLLLALLQPAFSQEYSYEDCIVFHDGKKQYDQIDVDITYTYQLDDRFNASNILIEYDTVRLDLWVKPGTFKKVASKSYECTILSELGEIRVLTTPKVVRIRSPDPKIFTILQNYY